MGIHQRADVLIETSLIEGDAAGKEMKKKRTLIVVHLKPRSYYPFTFPERMFLYSGKLYEKYRRRILPIAVFGRRRPQDEPTEFSWSLPFLDVLRFRYLTVQLKNRNWRSFLDRNNDLMEIKGMKKGLKEGREEGLKEGLKEGIEKGKIEGKQEVALKMLEKGMNPKTIAKSRACLPGGSPGFGILLPQGSKNRVRMNKLDRLRYSNGKCYAKRL